MRDYIDIGPCPTAEEPVQVGSAEYSERNPKEMKAFINQLRRQFGPEPAGAQLKIKANAHDFGTYHEVVCYYDNEEAEDYAFDCEAECPEYWDSEARKELGLEAVDVG